jgi:hypothetical protein
MTWKVPGQTLNLGDGDFCTQGPMVSYGAKSFMGPNPSISQKQKHDTLTIEVPFSQSGLDSLRVEGKSVKFERLDGFSIRELNIEGTGASTKKSRTSSARTNNTGRGSSSKQVLKKDDDDDWGFDVRQ